MCTIFTRKNEEYIYALNIVVLETFLYRNTTNFKPESNYSVILPIEF